MLYLDSAILTEAQIALKFGWIKGITTNPTLLGKSELSPEDTLTQLAAISPGELYYQLTATDFETMVSEGRKAYQIIGEKTVLKIPATAVGFQVTATLSSEITCAVTAIYSGAQTVIAKEAGAKYAIAYVNRATRLLGDGLALVKEMAQLLEGSQTEILAASLKSPREAADALQAGADHLTLPLEILQAMTTHELSEQTVTEFNEKGKGITLN
ncbi:transaldolase family protein [Crocosphaera sp. XPORK-15E]|uniref:transaldolase family protein n=1 Tax=Crocosphaera sp. XPORK-15E TaxID=3110247 RepID=UPI002B20DC17|nr:transaldolase family protein [Crocosphaera sp. XPORK-15E]MEA5534462.1 transaldolase family protein [Crocosphaera sp. XPORK-15E]